MGPRTLLVATGAALVIAGVGACGATASHVSHVSHAAGVAHSASASPSQRSTSQGSTTQGSSSQGAGTTAQTGTGSTSSTETGTSSTATGTGAAGGGQDETVGIFPASTRAQAIQLQQSADAGHEPWLTDPAQVAAAYARSAMNVSQPNVQRISATRYAVRVAPNAETVLTLTQPVRAGSGGIWEVVSATQQRM